MKSQHCKCSNPSLSLQNLSLDSLKMGFAHLLNSNAVVGTFKTRFNIPQDVDIEYYLEGNIENERHARVY